MRKRGGPKVRPALLYYIDMRRLLLIILTIFLIALVLVVGFSVASYLFVAGTTSTENWPALPATLENSESGTYRGRATWPELFVVASTTPLECQLNFADDIQASEASAFIADQKIRLDIVTQSDNNTVLSLVASSTADYQIWQQTMAATSTHITDLEIDSAEFKTLLLDTVPMAYVCHAWTVDMSVFARPESLYTDNE